MDRLSLVMIDEVICHRYAFSKLIRKGSHYPRVSWSNFGSCHLQDEDVGEAYQICGRQRISQLNPCWDGMPKANNAQVPNIDDVARWLGPPVEDAGDIGIYEGGGTDGPREDFVQKVRTIKDMPKAKVFRVSA